MPCLFPRCWVISRMHSGTSVRTVTFMKPAPRRWAWKWIMVLPSLGNESRPTQDLPGLTACLKMKCFHAIKALVPNRNILLFKYQDSEIILYFPVIPVNQLKQNLQYSLSGHWYCCRQPQTWRSNTQGVILLLIVFGNVVIMVRYYFDNVVTMLW